MADTNGIFAQALIGRYNERAGTLSRSSSAPPKTPGLIPQTPPESGDIASLHSPTNNIDRARASLRLREQRVALQSHIVEDKSFQDNRGNIAPRWIRKLEVMDIEEDGTLVSEPKLPAPTEPDSVEEIEYWRKLDRQERLPGPSPLKNEVVDRGEEEEGMTSARRYLRSRWDLGPADRPSPAADSSSPSNPSPTPQIKPQAPPEGGDLASLYLPMAAILDQPVADEDLMDV